jgi:oligopeptide transport system substrate-binding protein
MGTPAEHEGEGDRPAEPAGLDAEPGEMAGPAQPQPATPPPPLGNWPSAPPGYIPYSPYPGAWTPYLSAFPPVPPQPAKKRRAALWVGLVVGLVVVVLGSCVACGFAGIVALQRNIQESINEPTFTTNGLPAPNSAQVLHDALTIESSGDVQLDPALIRETMGMTPAQLIFPGLVTIDPRGGLEPWMAQSWEASPDGLTYTFHLRSGMTWSDGTPLTAASFAYSISRALDPCTDAESAWVLADIQDAAAYSAQACGQHDVPALLGRAIIISDPLTLVFKLRAPAASFPAALAHPIALAVPERLITAYGGDWTAHLATVPGGFGGNLFKVAAEDPENGTLVLERNDRFWGAKPKLREIMYSVYDEYDYAYEDFQRGLLDIGYPDPEEGPLPADTQSAPLAALFYLQMNWRAAPFDDLRMRQAFALALDKQSLARDTFGGAAMATNHIVPQGAPGFNPDLTGVDDTGRLSGAVSLAKQLAMAYASEKCAGSFAQCPPVRLTIVDEDDTADQLANDAVLMWHSAMPDYPITIVKLPYDRFTAEFKAKRLQLGYTSWLGDYPDAQDWLALQFLPGAAWNTGAVDDPAASALLTAAAAEQDATARLHDEAAAEQRLVGDVAWIPLAQAVEHFRVRPYVANYAIGPYDAPALDTWQQIQILQYTRS